MVVLRLPPGCQFHPTDKELVVEYLRRKVLAWPFPASIIPEVDVCKADPWELPVCKLLAWKEFILNCHYSDWSSSDRLSSGRQKSLEARTALSVLVPFIRLNQRYTDEAGATITWDLVVGGWDLEYSAEFVPNVEGLYIIAVGKRRKLGPSEEAIHNSFTSREAGKMVLSVDNTASRRK